MVRVCHDASSAIVGSEEVESMSDRQLEILVMYEWPKKHQGHDLDAFQGLGGLLYQMKREMEELENAKEHLDKSSPEERQLQVDGDRTDPHLVQLDALALELREMEVKGLLKEATFMPDWKTELGEGEEIYVEVE